MRLSNLLEVTQEEGPEQGPSPRGQARIRKGAHLAVPPPPLCPGHTSRSRPACRRGAVGITRGWEAEAGRESGGVRDSHPTSTPHEPGLRLPSHTLGGSVARCPSWRGPAGCWAGQGRGTCCCRDTLVWGRHGGPAAACCGLWEALSLLQPALV